MRVMLGSILLFLCGCNIPTLDGIILRPNTTIAKTPLDWGYEYQPFTLSPGEGRTIVGWYVPSVESKALLVVLPGSDSNKSRYAEGLQIYNPHGYDVLVADYEGFGDSPGPKSLPACVDDADAIVSYALGLHSKVFIYGVSLGGPLAAYETAKHPEIRGCMLEAPFVALEEAHWYLLANGWWLPPLWWIADLYIYPQVPDPYDIITVVAQIHQPKLIMQSTEDTITPYQGGVDVFNAAAEPKEFWEMRGDHGRMVRLDPDAYVAKVTGWLDAHVGE